MTGLDSYGLTASIVTSYLKQILLLDSLPSGIICPSEIPGARTILKELIEENKLYIDQELDFSFVKT